jgi:hypothetical protein
MERPPLTNDPEKPLEYWLPERYVLKLNALEVGYLQALLTKGGAHDKRLLEKIIAIVEGGLE